MKVTIGPYKNWIGPYQIAEWVPFLNEDQQHNLGKWLAETWVTKACNKIDKLRGDRKIKVRIDDYDTWSMDHTLAYIILPMLKQLKETKHGSPYTDLEDVPEHMRYEGENWVHYKWDWILNELIWTFEQLLDDNWESQYTLEEGEIDWDEYPEDEGKDVTPLRWKKPYVVDWEGRQAHQDRITNGLRLFGKYYQALWS